ncbi:hypothetical protein Pst134EB_021856 [Puccinia striiformis f. sp. tritici]|nr:hypothetical protein Pst134EB_021856 [Puccinia striiformis f. sp. tritici]
MMVMRAQHPWFLGTTFLLTYYSKYSIGFPPTVTHAEAEPWGINAFGHVPELIWDEFDDLEPILDLQPVSPPSRTAPEVSDDLSDSLKIWQDILKAKDLETAMGFLGYSNDGTNHDPISPGIPVPSGPQGNRPLDPPHIGASADSEFIVGHTALLSTKRSREEFEAHNGRQCMEEQQKAKKQIQGVLDSGDERLGPMGDVPDHNRSRKFEIMRWEAKWKPLFSWANASSGETKDSPIMRDFAARFDAEVEKLNNLRPSRLTTDLISLSDMPLDLHLIHDSDSIDSSQGSREFIIQLKRLRGRGKNYIKSMDRSKRRILDILEAMGLFHGLTVLHGLDPHILGNLEDLFAWFWSIFFEATEDGPPLFGLFKGTLEAAENAGKRFGSVKSEMSLVLANPKDLNPKDFFLYRLALSLIEYRYSMNASRLGECDRNTDHTGKFWIKMEDIRKSRQPGLEKSDKLSDELQKQILLYTGWNKSKLASFLQSLNDIAIKGVYDVYPDISQEIRDRLLTFTSRSKFDLNYGKKMNVKGSPIYVIPIYQREGTSTYQELFIGLLQFEEMSKPKYTKSNLTYARITKIHKSLIVILGIASKILGEQLKSDYTSLTDWFIGILFKGVHGQLPIFGWVTIPSTPDQSQLEQLFSRAHICLSKNLVDSRKQAGHQTHSISMSLFGIWYEDVALKDITLPEYHSFNGLLKKIASIINPKVFTSPLSANEYSAVVSQTVAPTAHSSVHTQQEHMSQDWEPSNHQN